MKLLELRCRAWCVLVAYDENDEPQVLAFLQSEADPRDAQKMLHLLRETVTSQGPRLHNERKAEHLAGDVWEFKAGPKRGVKLRVTYFMGGLKTVVCARAFHKRQQKTPQGEIAAAQAIHDQYQRDKARNQIQIERLGDGNG